MKDAAVQSVCERANFPLDLELLVHDFIDWIAQHTTRIPYTLSDGSDGEVSIFWSALIEASTKLEASVTFEADGAVSAYGFPAVGNGSVGLDCTADDVRRDAMEALEPVVKLLAAANARLNPSRDLPWSRPSRRYEQ